MSRKKRKTRRREVAESTFEHRPLAALKELRAGSGAHAPPPPAAPPREPESEPVDEREVFSRAMQDVSPLAGRPAPPDLPHPATPGSLAREEASVMQALRDLVDGVLPLAIHETDEAIEGLAEGVDPRLLHRLRRGEFAVQDHLDLHGMNRQQAREAVAAFLSDAEIRGLRCVLVVHGKGRGSAGRIPVLKTALASWFTRRSIRKRILAFCTARACDGGAGAVYVLLRPSRTPAG